MSQDKTAAALLPLYRARVARLEATVSAYDAALNTDAVDRMRKRIDALEDALHEAVFAGGVTNPRQALAMRGLGPNRVQEILILLSKKFAPRYRSVYTMCNLIEMAVCGDGY